MRPAILRVVAVAVLALLPALALAQQPAPVVPNPQAPTLNMPAPVGMQRGTKLELTLTGTNLAEPTGLWTSFPAKVTIPTDNNNGKTPTSLKVVLEVPADAPLGFGAIRLATASGMSNLRLFCIDDLPQVVEVDTNRSKATAQAIPVPCVVVGRADAEVNDYFKFTAKAGQRLSFDLLGRRLGSAFDPQIYLYDAKTGRELPGSYSNDSPGAQTDPRLSYTFKTDGEYLVEVRDLMYRGGPDFYYRLRIGDFPIASTPIPMAGKRGTKVKVDFAGPMTAGVAPVEVTVPADPNIETVWVTPRSAAGQSGWPVALAVSDLDEAVEQEPNDEPAKANRIPVPGAITARFLKKGEADHFVFTAKKGQRLVIEAHAMEHYSPTEVDFLVLDAKGAQVAALNLAGPSRLDFTPAADGDYTLVVRHMHGWGSPEESYRLTVTPYEPGFSLSVPLDRWNAPQGGVVTIPIVLAARRDYAGPIEVSVAGPAGFTGQATIAANVPQAPPPPAPAPAAAQLVVTVGPDVPMGPHRIQIIGKAMINGKAVTEVANVRTVVSAGLGALPIPPRDLYQHVAIAVTEKPPYSLTAKFDTPEVLKGGPATVTITATRAPAFMEEIAITAGPLPANVAPALKNIPKGQNEVKVTLTPNAQAAIGKFNITFTGKAKFQNKDFTVSTTPVPLVVSLPFELKVEPVPVKVAQGDKVKFKVTATRKGGYQGPIALEVRALPANVTAPKATIEMAKNDVEIELTAAAAAAVADKADVNVLGIATAAGNQQAATPNFTVSVVKK